MRYVGTTFLFIMYTCAVFLIGTRMADWAIVARTDAYIAKVSPLLEVCATYYDDDPEFQRRVVQTLERQRRERRLEGRR